jgi:hypothetical protein
MGNAGPRGAKGSHSIRCHNDVWEKAKRRAKQEGTVLNAVLEEILEGYGDGLINLPKVTKSYASVITQPK